MLEAVNCAIASRLRPGTGPYSLRCMRKSTARGNTCTREKSWRSRSIGSGQSIGVHESRKERLCRPFTQRSSATVEPMSLWRNFRPALASPGFFGHRIECAAGISERRLERMVNPALTRVCRIPGCGCRTQFGVHDAQCADRCQREQSAGASASVDSITTSGNKKTTFPWG